MKKNVLLQLNMPSYEQILLGTDKIIVYNAWGNLQNQHSSLPLNIKLKKHKSSKQINKPKLPLSQIHRLQFHFQKRAIQKPKQIQREKFIKKNHKKTLQKRSIKQDQINQAKLQITTSCQKEKQMSYNMYERTKLCFHSILSLTPTNNIKQSSQIDKTPQTFQTNQNILKPPCQMITLESFSKKIQKDKLIPIQQLSNQNNKIYLKTQQKKTQMQKELAKQQQMNKQNTVVACYKQNEHLKKHHLDMNIKFVELILQNEKVFPIQIQLPKHFIKVNKYNNFLVIKLLNILLLMQSNLIRKIFQPMKNKKVFSSLIFTNNKFEEIQVSGVFPYDIQGTNHIYGEINGFICVQVLLASLSKIQSKGYEILTKITIQEGYRLLTGKFIKEVKNEIMECEQRIREYLVKQIKYYIIICQRDNNLSVITKVGFQTLTVITPPSLKKQFIFIRQFLKQNAHIYLIERQHQQFVETVQFYHNKQTSFNILCSSKTCLKLSTDKKIERMLIFNIQNNRHSLQIENKNNYLQIVLKKGVYKLILQCIESDLMQQNKPPIMLTCLSNKKINLNVNSKSKVVLDNDNDRLQSI